MPRLIVVCHSEDCRNSAVRNPTNPRPMKCVGEFASAWNFLCETCGSRRIVTKDVAGGMFGVGQRDDGTGPRGGKGPEKYRRLGGVIK